MTIREIILIGKKKLENITDAPLLEAEMLFSFVFGKSKEYILARDDSEIPERIAKKYFSLIEKRKTGIPLPYITHTREFMGIDFFVNEDVLIPRQETETLVEEALRIASGKKLHVLDIGTGSGCILISFLFYNKVSSGIGIDISSEAIEVAKKNAKILGIYERAKFLNEDFREFTIDEKFDMILSNPPYVRDVELHSVSYEPVIALRGGKNGTDIYPELIEKSYFLLDYGGIFITEIDYRDSDKIFRIFKKTGFSEVKILKDLSGRERFVKGKK